MTVTVVVTGPEGDPKGTGGRAIHGDGHGDNPPPACKKLLGLLGCWRACSGTLVAVGAALVCCAVFGLHILFDWMDHR